MPHAIGGFLYEKKIFEIMNSIGLVPEGIKETAGASSLDPDIVVQLNGQRVNIEVKQNINAQSGGTSIKYSRGNPLELVKELPCLTNKDINNKLQSHIDNLNDLLEFFSIDKIPFTTTKAKWVEAVNEGVIKKASTRIISSTSFIEEHYDSKDINYIHFGKHGLFYMKEDKLKLGIPRLNGNVVLEIRPTRNGSKLNASGVRVCSGSLRIQARIKDVKKSTISLEDGKSFLELVSGLNWEKKLEYVFSMTME